MSRPFNPLSIQILKKLSTKPENFKKLHKELCPQQPYKFFYNAMFRLVSQELVQQIDDHGALLAKITEEGRKLIQRQSPEKDGVCKIVIFDIPEKHKKVRGLLRSKLKQLGFKKWQNSIWISPYALEASIEEEFQALANKFFIRLIKTTDINETKDIEKMFA